MRRSTVLSALCYLIPFLSHSTAVPTPDGGGVPHPHTSPAASHDCISDADANKLVQVYISTTVKFDPSYVSQFFTEDFTLWCDGVNYLLKLPLQTPTSTNPTEYITSTYSLTTTVPQPPTKIQYVTHNCHEITARALQLDHPNVVSELYLFEARKVGETWKLAVAYSEFNNAADAANIAAAIAAGTAPPRRVRRGEW